jgi:hypothetical protein
MRTIGLLKIIKTKRGNMKYRFRPLVVEAVQVIKEQEASNAEFKLDTVLNCFSSHPKWLNDLIEEEDIAFCYDSSRDCYQLEYQFPDQVEDGDLIQGDWLVLEEDGTKHVYCEQDFKKYFGKVEA